MASWRFQSAIVVLLLFLTVFQRLSSSTFSIKRRPSHLSSPMASSIPSRSPGGSYLRLGGPYQFLSALEITWRDRQQFLQSKGSCFVRASVLDRLSLGYRNLLAS